MSSNSPKKRTNVIVEKKEFVRSFFGRIRGYQKSFQNYLTFNIPQPSVKSLLQIVGGNSEFMLGLANFNVMVAQAHLVVTCYLWLLSIQLCPSIFSGLPLALQNHLMTEHSKALLQLT